MKYKILIDYGSEGMKFEDDVYDNLNDAVKAAIENNYGNSFLIVQIIEWEVIEKVK